MLHEVENSSNGKAWCGPTVVASITGRDVARIKTLIKKRRGSNDAVKGTAWFELRHVLAYYGYQEDARHTILKPDRPTLAQWLRRERDMTAYYILDVGCHWVVVHGRKFCDTFTGGKPVFIRKAPHRRKRVREVYKIVRR
jgi:hypothetical protein